MDPETGSGPAQREDGDSGRGFDPEAALRTATERTRADVIADIIGHPAGAISMNPALGEDAIRRHLNTLIDVGVVAVRQFEPGHRHRKYPDKFYELTAEARELFDRNGLFPQEAWRRQYRAVRKTPRIRDLEEMPRPETER